MFQTRTLTQVKAQLNGGLIASCQPVPVGPVDKDEIVLAMALACQAGGAAAVRIEGARLVQLVADALRIPVIGIVKRDLPDSCGGVHSDDARACFGKRDNISNEWCDTNQRIG